jgi:hypothetical protein
MRDAATHADRHPPTLLLASGGRSAVRYDTIEKLWSGWRNRTRPVISAGWAENDRLTSHGLLAREV